MSSRTLDPVFATEAARIIDVSVETIRTWEKTGKLPALKTARGVRVFDRRDCVRLARERETRRAAHAQAVLVGA
jgi:DNA-binding transcriptional MerR regulator